MDMKHHSWLGRTINVIDSSDVSLIGMKGLVLDETCLLYTSDAADDL